jgi:hypothetical protein
MVIPMSDVAGHTRRLGSAPRASAGDVHSERAVTDMDCAMHPLLARCVRRRTIACTTHEAKPARPVGAANRSDESYGEGGTEGAYDPLTCTFVIARHVYSLAVCTGLGLWEF